jgi:hypothetical protein
VLKRNVAPEPLLDGTDPVVMDVFDAEVELEAGTSLHATEVETLADVPVAEAGETVSELQTPAQMNAPVPEREDLELVSPPEFVLPQERNSSVAVDVSDAEVELEAGNDPYATT